MAARKEEVKKVILKVEIAEDLKAKIKSEAALAKMKMADYVEKVLWVSHDGR